MVGVVAYVFSFLVLFVACRINQHVQSYKIFFVEPLFWCLKIMMFCLVFSRIFNIISALKVHQPLTLPQKIDSREGLY